MPQWVVTVQCTVEAATREEAKDWLADELNEKLGPGEEGSPWQTGVGEAPRYQLASIRQVVAESPTSRRGEG